jgi:hypothetical protein
VGSPGGQGGQDAAEVVPYIAYGPATLLFEVLLADDEGERLADFHEQPSIAAGLAEARKWAED